VTKEEFNKIARSAVPVAMASYDFKKVEDIDVTEAFPRFAKEIKGAFTRSRVTVKFDCNVSGDEVTCTVKTVDGKFSYEFQCDYSQEGETPIANLVHPEGKETYTVEF